MTSCVLPWLPVTLFWYYWFYPIKTFWCNKICKIKHWHNTSKKQTYFFPSILSSILTVFEYTLVARASKRSDCTKSLSPARKILWHVISQYFPNIRNIKDVEDVYYKSDRQYNVFDITSTKQDTYNALKKNRQSNTWDFSKINFILRQKKEVMATKSLPLKPKA